MRIGVDAPSRGRGCRRAAAVSTARARASPRDASGGGGCLDDLRSPPCRRGSGSSSAPGRPSRSRCRGPRASRRPELEQVAALGARLLPDSIRPGGSGTRRRIESAVTLLPQPLSPTMPTLAPAGTSNDTPSTARSLPASVWKLVTRPVTRRSGSGMAAFIDQASQREGRVRARARAGCAISSRAPSCKLPPPTTNRRSRCEQHTGTSRSARSAWLSRPSPPPSPRADGRSRTVPPHPLPAPLRRPPRSPRQAAPEPSRRRSPARTRPLRSPPAPCWPTRRRP